MFTFGAFLNHAGLHDIDMFSGRAVTSFATDAGSELARLELAADHGTRTVAGQAAFDFIHFDGTRHGVFEIVQRAEHLQGRDVKIL